MWNIAICIVAGFLILAGLGRALLRPEYTGDRAKMRLRGAASFESKIQAWGGGTCREDKE